MSGRTGVRRAVRVLAGAAAALLLGAFPALADPPLWRVKPPGGGGEVVLFGSVHLLAPGLDWRYPELDAELAKARDLWFEIPMDGTSGPAATAAAQARSRLPEGETLTQHLSKAGRERLARVARQLGLAPDALDRYRPWFAEVTLTLLQLQARGASESFGVEETLARAAPATARKHAFETPEEQVKLLADAPVAEQAASLEETLREIEEDPNAFEELQSAWTSGDVAWIEREAVAPLRQAAPEIYRRLVAARNRRWAAEIERLLKGGERAFIVVGVGHLVGPDSVPALLRRHGFVVEGP